MLNVATGTLEPQATDYMRRCCAGRLSPATAVSAAACRQVPLHENKIGSAFDTLQDVMYAELPNGQRLVIAAFTNGWDSQEAEPWDVAKLGDFTARLLQKLRLDDAAGSEPRYLEAAPARDGAVSWEWHVPQAGRYELALWHEADPGNTHEARANAGDAGPASKKSRRSTSPRGAAAGSGSATSNSSAARPSWC